MNKTVLAFLFCIVCFSCRTNNTFSDFGSGNLDSVFVKFFNESSFKVSVYRNINPSSEKSSTKPIAVISPGAIEEVKLPPSVDQEIGDVFYVHYYVQLADSLSSGLGEPLYIEARQSISNISFVLKKNEHYTKTILQPKRGELKFNNGYVKVQNTGRYTIQVMLADSHLKGMGKEELNLSTGGIAFYEFASNIDDESIEISSLKFFITSTGQTLNVPSFTLNRGKIYEFQCDGIKTTAPSIFEIIY